ncbi:MAG TPA: biotin carboxylase N-terminal domain-containing protein, partial [Planctomycetota bacterium]|nr:biotin carboxylase N-terminal domain-containing protein [Planctomycetota bacterium]
MRHPRGSSRTYENLHVPTHPGRHPRRDRPARHRTAREMGIETVAIYSDVDRKALLTRMAHRAVALGSSLPRESYLDMRKVFDGAKESGAEAIHPGYGFLSKNATFAERVKDADLVWIGPPPGAIRARGDKITSRRNMKKACVPVVPGLTDPVDDVKAAKAAAAEIGYPIALKAAADGGGKGIRTVLLRLGLVRGGDRKPAREAGGQRLEAHGLGDVPLEVVAEEFAVACAEHVGGEGDHRRARPAVLRLQLAQASRRAAAIQARHVQVHQHQVEAPSCEGRTGLEAVLDQFSVDAQALQQALRDAPVDGVVLGHEHAARLEALRDAVALGRQRGCGCHRGRRRVHVEGEARTLRPGLEQQQVAAHQACQAARDRQAEPGPSEESRGGLVTLGEGLEDVLVLIG